MLPFTLGGRLGITRVHTPNPTPSHHEPKHQMRAEIEQLSDAAKQSIGLLRRHL